MLILSRLTSERIMIDGGIIITLVEVRGEKVRIGIDAPKGVGIWREELLPVSHPRPDKPPIQSLVRLGESLPGEC